MKNRVSYKVRVDKKCGTGVSPVHGGKCFTEGGERARRPFHKLVVRALAVAAAVGCGSVFSTDYTWRGGGVDSNWSTAENWSPNGVPGKDDTVIFDAQSTGTSYVDEGLAKAAHDKVSGADYAAVSVCTLDTGFSGKIVLQRALCVQKTYTQNAGAFACGDSIFRLGSLTTRDYWSASKHGEFFLNGGTFTAPSTEFQHYSVSHQVQFQINEGAVFNHNNGTFISESSCGGGSMSFTITDRVFNNFIFRRAPGTSGISSQIFSVVSTNTVLGDFTLDAGVFSSKDSVWIVKGDVTVSGVANGGNAAILLNGTEEQTVTALDGKGKCIGLIVDKPEDSWVRFVGGKELIFNMDAQASNSGYHGLEFLNGGGLDFSGVSGIRFNCYHTRIHFPPKEKVVLPQTVKMFGYNPQPRAKDFVFTNLSFGTYDSRLDFGDNVTNTVLGELRVTAGGFKNATSILLVHGNYRVDESYKSAAVNGGGNGWVVLCGEDDQTVSITNSTCNSLRIDKPEGSTVTVDSPDGCLWLGHRQSDNNGSYISGEGSFDMRGGILDVSRGGIVMTNGCYGTLKQTGGQIRWGERGLSTYLANGGHSYTVNFGDFMIPRYEALGKKGGGNNTICTVSVSNFVNRGATVTGTVKVYGDHYIYADTKAIIKDNLRYCGDADQRVFAEEGASFTGTSGQYKSVQKTGGTLTLDSDLKVSDWNGDSFAISETSSVDLNGHTLETPGDIKLNGRAMFSGASGQLKAGRVLYILDKGTIAFDLPTEPDNVPFLYGKDVYFDHDTTAFTNTVEVLSKAKENSVSPVHLIATEGNKFYNWGGSWLNREPVWQYVIPFNIRKPKAVVSAAEGKVDFTWKLKHGLRVLVR